MGHIYYIGCIFAKTKQTYKCGFEWKSKFMQKVFFGGIKYILTNYKSKMYALQKIWKMPKNKNLLIIYFLGTSPDISNPEWGVGFERNKNWRITWSKFVL